eukprot:CCRYP_009569-RA/>CCRYP_009569-RA protein AED:0.02 eAED:0.02 QI:425/1/1/1/1/1/2/375/1020
MSSEGACPLHPAIRLKRYNRRTGEWKTLLETCPLCASGLPATSSSGASAYDDYDDEGTVSSRSSRFSRSSRPSGGGSSIYGRERDGSLLSRDGGHANPDDRSTYSTATTHTGTTGATDQTYVTDSKSLSSMSTRKQRNSVRDVGGRDDYATDDDNGYKTEDHDSDTDMDSSNRSGLSRGVRFGPGTKEGSELGTDLDSDGSEQDDRNYLKESIHSNYDPYDGREDDVDNNNPTYNTNNDLNNFMMNDKEKRSSASSQYSNTPNTKAPLPSALKPSSFGPSHHEVTAGSIVLYDGHKTSEQHNSSLTSLHDDRLAQQQQYPVEKQKYRPPPPPRREEEHSPNENAIMCHDITPAPLDKSSNRSASRSRNERSASRSRDVRPAPPQRAASQPRSSSRGRGTSTTRQRDSSRSRPKEGDSIQPSTSSNGKHALPPGRSRSRSRQPSRSRGREDRQPTVPPQQPPPPVGILKNGIRNNVGSTQPYNPKEAKDAEETLDNIYYDDNATRAHANHPRQPVPPPRSSGLTPPPLNNNTRMRMEPPETPQEELDSYSTHSRDSNRRHAAPPRANIPPPNHPGDQPRGNPQDHRRRLSESSGQLPLPSVNGRIPQPPRSSPMYLQNDPRDNASMNSYENRSQEKAPPRLRGMQPVADRSESSHEPNQPRAAKNTPKKNRRSVDSQPGFTESETNASDAPSANADHNDSETPVMAQASAYDDKGRCVKHPHIKLRKKKLLGGWKVMLVNCPDCCIEEMLKMRRNGPGRAGQSDAKGEKVKRSPSEDSHSSAAMPPISQLTIRNKNDDDQSSSSGSASEITYGTKTDYSRSSAMGSWQQYGPGGHNNPIASADNSGSGSGPHRVTRMPFTDPYGHKGWYTGEVASGSGLPHGKGTMHYCDGRMRGGLWSNGLAAAGGGSGGTLNKMGSKSSGSGSSVSSQHSHHSRKEHPPPSLDRESVVVGMEWMDLNGRCGFFTGETDEQRKPHGMGSMRYNDGKVLEGEWHHGEFDRHGGRGDGSVKSSRSRSRGTAF